ncbi:hypothetical protein BLA60_08095 [Actinophytocola xinjiangensis]|uniref:Uncharacterized protein n=1 Tax=Actinophytocola xinjiangensis TaxID=485602 RepID=A0A7Z0WNU3_9PSEU|nr:hypothetical protein BLA60_08095 [Actinophytocola xinjiangensis]
MAVFTVVFGPLMAAFVITRGSTVVGVGVGVPLVAAGGFAVGALVAGAGSRAVERAWISIGLVGLAIVVAVVAAAFGW